MKIIVDGRPLLTPLTGVGKYTYEISKRLLRNHDVVFFYGYYSNKMVLAKNNFLKRLVGNNLAKKFVKKLLDLSPGIEHKNHILDADIFWQPNFIPNLDVKAKRVVVTIHDFSFENREWHPNYRYDYFKENFYKYINRADHIITVSNFVKREAIEKLKFKEKDISVVYNGIDHSLFIPLTKKSMDLPDKYILYVGSLEPRKNIKTLIKAYLLLKDIKRKFKLVLVGFKGWKNADIMKMIKKNKKYIKYLGYVEESKMPEIYSRATLFVYPSLYEGFGIPPLEAMSCGTPVIASNRFSLPEVCGDAAFYCDPTIKGIALALNVLVNDENLRKKLISKGLEHSKKYSWNKSALEHEKIFKRLINGSQI